MLDTLEVLVVGGFAVARFLFSQDEPDGYFNLDRETRYELLDLLSRAGVRACFCGPPRRPQRSP